MDNNSGSLASGEEDREVVWMPIRKLFSLTSTCNKKQNYSLQTQTVSNGNQFSVVINHLWVRLTEQSPDFKTQLLRIPNLISITINMIICTQ